MLGAAVVVLVSFDTILLLTFTSSIAIIMTPAGLYT